jgi:ribosomal protein S18 acetylase RimI-like enzyme
VRNTTLNHAVAADRETLHIDDLCVDAECRGMGIGKLLMAAAVEHARELGVYDIDLNVWEFNTDARMFYESLGFSTRQRRMELVL